MSCADAEKLLRDKAAEETKAAGEHDKTAATKAAAARPIRAKAIQMAKCAVKVKKASMWCHLKLDGVAGELADEATKLESAAEKAVQQAKGCRSVAAELLKGADALKDKNGSHFTDITPKSGPASGGTPFRITGKDLPTPASEITFNDKNATAIKVTGTEATGKTPPGAKGKARVCIVKGDDEVCKPDFYEYT